jgi:phosphomannomutase
LNIVSHPYTEHRLPLFLQHLNERDTNFQVVEEQAVSNGDFPTVKSPNPEEPEVIDGTGTSRKRMPILL